MHFKTLIIQEETEGVLGKWLLVEDLYNRVMNVKTQTK